MSSNAIPKTRAAGRILGYARRRASLTQRELAERSGVPQETIARIESSSQSPRFDTLAHLLAACGFELEIDPKKGVGVDVSLIRVALAMSAPERAGYASRSNDASLRLTRRVRRIAEES